MDKQLNESFFRKHYAFIGIVFIGIVLRYIFITQQGLSNDELSALVRTRFQSWDEFWYYGVKFGDMHPAFYQAFLWFWVKGFGENELLFRASSLLFYVANCLLFYRLSCRYVSKKAGIYVLAFIAVLTFTVINTAIARPYNSGSFFILLLVNCIIDLQKKGYLNFRIGILIVLSFLGAMLSHYFAFLAAGVIGLCAFVYLDKKLLIRFSALGLFAMLLFIPHWSVTYFHLTRGGLGWLPEPGWNWLYNFGVALFNGMNGLFILLSSVAIFGWYKIRKTNVSREIKFMLGFTILTYCLAHLISITFTPILRDIVMLFTLPFVLLLLFYGITQFNKRWVFYFFMSTIVLGLFSSLWVNPFYKPIHYGEFKEIANEINMVDHSADSEVAFNFCSNAYINYYLKQKRVVPFIDYTSDEAVYELVEKVSISKSNDFIYAWSNFMHIPMYYEVLRRSFKQTVNFRPFFNSAFLHMKKGEERNDLGRVGLKQTVQSNLSSHEFIGGFSLSCNELKEKLAGGTYFVLETEIDTLSVDELYIVCVAERNAEMIVKDERPLYYIAYNQCRLNLKDGFGYLAFDIPEQLTATDKLKFYIWNPLKAAMNFKGWKLYKSSFD